VLHALSTGQTGGTEMSVLRLLPALAARGVDGAVSLLDEDGPVADLFRAAGVRVHALGARRGWMNAVRRFEGVLAEERPGVVHAYGFRMSVLARLRASAISPRPAIVHGIRGLHLTDDANPEGASAALARVVERTLAGQVDCYMANSLGAIDYLSAKGLPREKFVLVRNGIDAAHRVASPAPREPLVACVASLRPVKQVAHLVSALDTLARRGAAFKAVIAGTGPLAVALARDVEARGLGSRVTFLGRLAEDDVTALLAKCRLLVLPSRWEGMPVSVMEAMAAAVPVVAYDVAGVNELVQDEVTGLLAPAGDVGALAVAIEQLLADPGRAASLGAAGRERVCREFTLDAQVEGHQAAYERLGRASALPTTPLAAGSGRA
jgi:glycosyltransferase involved in cell wall biosynthesis